MKISPKNHKWNGTNKCVRCGCEKTNQYGVLLYNRTGIPFGTKPPECIDWDIENNKTID